MTVLPGTPRYGGLSYGKVGIDLAMLFQHRSVFARIASQSIAVSPRHIARSDYNLAHLGPAALRPFSGLAGLRRQIVRAVRRTRGPSYVYAYWPGLDTIGHHRGIESPAALAHLAALEEHIGALSAALAGTDTALVISADHGQIDTTPADVTDIGDHPELADCLRIPLCGEPRAAFCYVRPDRVDAFETYCAEVLGPRFALHHSAELMEQGLYGLGPPHPRLAERIGDYTLIARGSNVIRDRLLADKPFRQVGVHGGLSDAELRVPLCLLRC
jgi:hypothetical protein